MCVWSNVCDVNVQYVRVGFDTNSQEHSVKNEQGIST